jgi:hypothetical protein
VVRAIVTGSPTAGRQRRRAITRLKTAMHRHQQATPCPAKQKRRERTRRERTRREFLAFDPFRNSTEYEEYRPS